MSPVHRTRGAFHGLRSVGWGSRAHPPYGLQDALGSIGASWQGMAFLCRGHEGTTRGMLEGVLRAGVCMGLLDC